MKANVINEGLKYGIVCGLVAVLITYVSWAMGLQTFITVGFYAKFIPYMIAILIFGGLQVRKQNEGGLLPFAQALKFSFFAYVVAAIIIAICTYILYNIIDKELTQKSMQVAIEKVRTMLEKFGQSEEEIAKAIKKTEESAKDTGPGRILLGSAFGLIWDFIVSLLIALVIRKEEKLAE